MQYSMNLDNMLHDGFTRKYANYFLNILESEKKNPVFEPDFVAWAHSNGFSAETASVLGLTDDNLKNYLPEYVFYKVWPLNSWSRIWVNDKLTLKYALSGYGMNQYMPKYYYYSTASGLRALMDNPLKASDGASFLQTLREVGEFACKPCNGTQSAGFFRLSYEGNEFTINGQNVSEDEIADFANTHPNYVFTEYLNPSEEWAQYSPLIHTIRIMIINEHGNDPRIVGNYIRIPYNDVGSANYIYHDGTNNDKYNLYVSIDMDTGEFGNALAIYPNGVKELTHHPDTGALLSGTIQNFERLKKAALDIALWFNNLEFIGFDFGITTEGLKIMEINTHPAIMVSQIRNPLYMDERNRQYFESKIREIDSMSDEEKLARNSILR